MKLLQLLKEIKIKSPTPKVNNNQELLLQLNNNEDFKKEVLDYWFYKIRVPYGDPDEWLDVINSWYKNDFELLNNVEKPFIDDGEDNRLFVSTKYFGDQYGESTKIKIGPNILYVMYI